MKNGLHIDKNGGQEWYLNGKLHREDGPAVIETNGDEFWLKKGLYHRLDGQRF